MKKSTTIIIAICCLVFVGAGIALAAYGGDVSSILFRFGQIEREHLRSSEASASSDSTSRDDIFVANNDFVIYESEISRIDEQYKLTGIQDGRERAIRFLMRRNILFTEALARGIYVDEEEVWDLINHNIQIARTAENYESDFLVFLSGLGMTDEEYWESQFDVFRKDIAIDKLFSSIAAASGLSDQEAVHGSIQSYFQELVEDYVRANDLEAAYYGFQAVE